MIPVKDLHHCEYGRRTDTKVTGLGFEERVFGGLGALVGGARCGSRLLSGTGFGFGRLVIETRT